MSLIGVLLWIIYTELFRSSPSDSGSTRTHRVAPYLVAGLVIALLVGWWAAGRPSPSPLPAPAPAPAIAPTATRPTIPTHRTPAASLPTRAPAPADAPAASAAPVGRSLRLLVDDFEPQPLQGQQMYFYNRLEGDRGAINNALLTFGRGQVTTTVAAAASWAGVWMSLNHPIREGVGIDLGSILPAPILPPYQSAVVGIEAQVARGTAGGVFRLELKDHGALLWTGEAKLSGGKQLVSFVLPALDTANEFVWVLDRASPGDSVVLDNVSLTVTSEITDTASAAFVWSYGQFLGNWNPETGLVRDKARDASGEFDAVQATGSLAAATALAEQLGVISRADAVRIVDRISDALLNDLPRWHGLWPHWVRTGPGGVPVIVPETEWSSLDSAIAALGLLTAQSSLRLDTSSTERMLREIDWPDLLTPGGIRHGYKEAGDPLPYAWDAFGGESWLMALAYAAGASRVSPLTYPSPPTANGSGFIDELVWLLVPPPQGLDAWGNDWESYRATAAEKQIAYFRTHYPASCLAHLALFGLSAAEGPDPAAVSAPDIYQAFGVGGRFAGPNDGFAHWDAPVAVPHYAAMIASLGEAAEATDMWASLIDNGYLTPLTNVESLLFWDETNCDARAMTWNSLKGSWNLALQTLGWGRRLAQRRGHTPILWQAVTTNLFLRNGYCLLAPHGSASAPICERTFLPAVSQGSR